MLTQERIHLLVKFFEEDQMRAKRLSGLEGNEFLAVLTHCYGYDFLETELEELMKTKEVRQSIPKLFGISLGSL